MRTAKLISFEGIDGAGKSTHIPFVQTLLEAAGKSVVLTREPGGTPLGEQLRAILLQQNMQVETEAMLMFAARRENIAQIIAPALAAGHWVITDRFTDSSLAYQGGGRQMALEKLEALAHIAGVAGSEAKQASAADLTPDLTLLFDVPLEVARERLNKSRASDKFEQEEAQFFDAVRQQYLQLAKRNPQRIQVIDARASIGEIEQQLRQILSPLLAAKVAP